MLPPQTDIQRMVNDLAERGALRSSRVAEALKKVRREDFVLPEHLSEAYLDTPLPIGQGQTISQPYVVAFMLELLDPKASDKVLDLGSGSGWTTALLAELVPEGKVYGVERIPELVALGKENLAKYQYRNAKILPSKKGLGLPAQAPFQKILASAAAEEMPAELLRQLAPGGRMVVPIGNSIWKIDKGENGEVHKEEFSGFVFVPLL